MKPEGQIGKEQGCCILNCIVSDGLGLGRTPLRGWTWEEGGGVD